MARPKRPKSPPPESAKGAQVLPSLTQQGRGPGTESAKGAQVLPSLTQQGRGPEANDVDVGNNTYWTEDNPSGYLAEDLRDLDKDEQLKVMTSWFFQNFEDPAENTPYVSADGGYQWIWGGPYNASEQLGSEFHEYVPEEIIEEAAAQVESDGLFDWAPKHPERVFDRLEADPLSTGGASLESPALNVASGNAQSGSASASGVAIVGLPPRKRIGLFANSEHDRIQISNEDVVPVTAVINELEASRVALSSLRQELEGLCGDDEEPKHGDNKATVPMSKESLEVLRATVDRAIALQNSQYFTRSDVESTKSTLDDFAAWTQIIEGVGAPAIALSKVLGAISAAGTALLIFYEKLNALLY